jgi:ApaG protein
MAQTIGETSTATTHGVRVDVRCRYIENQSQPVGKRYVFAYRIRIMNESNVSVQLLSRRWIITDSNGKVKEITGAGVVGEQPIIHPGETYTYESSAMLETSNGVMKGSYTMHSVAGRTFDAEVAPFLLSLPHSLN